ncbi:MAG: Asp23/Gls24 family envelope stress response protein [Lachnospiraceae bacterium]|nr:Asp23/Gls24 family envelope stress response protein [Lachnospiraceae bacterium]
MAEKRTTVTLREEGEYGQVQIADEVVAIIAGLAAMEVKGVSSMAGGKFGVKTPSKGVRIDILEGVVCVDLALNIDFGYSIPETSKKVQEKVKAAIENMTGLEVSDVNVHVTGVDMEQEN